MGPSWGLMAYRETQRASLVAQLVKNLPAMQETPVWFLGQEYLLEKDRLPSQVFLGFPGGSAGKESTQSTRDLGLIPGLGRFPGEGNGYPLQYSGLENSMNCRVHGVAKSWTRLSNFHFHVNLSSCSSRSMEHIFSAAGKIYAMMVITVTKWLASVLWVFIVCWSLVLFLKMKAKTLF